MYAGNVITGRIAKTCGGIYTRSWKTMDNKLIEFYAEIKRETDKAVLAFDGANDIWLPKSKITIKKLNVPDVEITLPEWLAKQKGII